MTDQGFSEETPQRFWTYIPWTKKDLYYLRITKTIAEGSKCLRAKYAAILVKDGRIIATGYNGKPKGAINDHICYRENLEDNAAKPNCCIHSEANCLLHSSPIERVGATMYVSGIPCTDCSLLIMASGVSRLVYLNGAASSGHLGNSDLEYFKRYGFETTIDIVAVDPGSLERNIYGT